MPVVEQNEPPLELRSHKVHRSRMSDAPRHSSEPQQYATKPQRSGRSSDDVTGKGFQTDQVGNPGGVSASSKPYNGRANLTSWKKGTSGNPRGRPPALGDIGALAR